MKTKDVKTVEYGTFKSRNRIIYIYIFALYLSTRTKHGLGVTQNPRRRLGNEIPCSLGEMKCQKGSTCSQAESFSALKCTN